MADHSDEPALGGAGFLGGFLGALKSFGGGFVSLGGTLEGGVERAGQEGDDRENERAQDGIPRPLNCSRLGYQEVGGGDAVRVFTVNSNISLT